jgi:hypothetical protein
MPVGRFEGIASRVDYGSGFQRVLKKCSCGWNSKRPGGLNPHANPNDQGIDFFSILFQPFLSTANRTWASRSAEDGYLESMEAPKARLYTSMVKYCRYKKWVVHKDSWAWTESQFIVGKRDSIH